MLFSLTQYEFSKTLFPLGGLLKTEVRELAEIRGFVNAAKPDSQDICFVKDGDYAAFLENVLKIPSPPGNFVDAAGKTLGPHNGLIHYTIGQRRGLHIGFGERKYVVRLDCRNNAVVLGENSDLYRDTLLVGDINLISVEKIDAPMKAAVKTRYKQPEAPAMLYPQEDGRILIRLDKPQRAVTPGQAAVFYDGDVVIGGGTILAEE